MYLSLRVLLFTWAIGVSSLVYGQPDWVRNGIPVPTAEYAISPTLPDQSVMEELPDGSLINAVVATNVNNATIDVLVYRFNPLLNSWEEFGTDPDPNTPDPAYVSDPSAYELSIKVLSAPSGLYLAVLENRSTTSVVSVLRYVSAWSEVVPPRESSGFDLKLDGLTPYLAFANAISLELEMVDCLSGAPAFQGTEPSIITLGAKVSLAFDNFGSPHVAFQEDNQIYLYKFDSDWIQLGSGPAAGDMTGSGSLNVFMVGPEPVIFYTNVFSDLVSLLFNGISYEAFNPTLLSMGLDNFSIVPLTVNTFALHYNNNFAQTVVVDYAQTEINPLGNSASFSSVWSGYSVFSGSQRLYLAGGDESSPAIYGLCNQSGLSAGVLSSLIEICVGDQANFVSNAFSPNPGNIAYVWSDEFFNVVSTDADFSIPNAQTFDTKNYFYDIIDACGLTASSSPITLNVTLGPDILSSSAYQICETGGVLSATVTGATSFSWSTSDGTGNFSDAGTENPTYTPSPNDVSLGSISVRITASNSAGCTSISPPAIVLIEEAITVDAGPDINVCSSEGSALITATASGGNTLSTWSVESVSDGSLFNPQSLGSRYDFGFNDRNNGALVVLRYTVVGSACLTQFDELNLTITPETRVDFKNTLFHCFDTDGSFITVPGGLIQGTALYEWSSNDPLGTFSSTTAKSPTYTFSAAETASAGTTILTLDVQANGSCPGFSDDLLIKRLLAPTINAGSDATICGESITFGTASLLNALGGEWSTTNGTGFFTPDNRVANATYILSEDDKLLSDLEFEFTALNNGCGAASDLVTYTLNINTIPNLNAGPDQVITGNTVSLNAVLTGLGETSWSTSGTGSFSNPAALNTVYTFSDLDLNDGKVELLVRTLGEGACTNYFDLDTVIVAIQSPNTISGTIAEANRPVVLLKKLNGLWYPVGYETADASGAYAFSNVSNGEYLLYYRNLNQKLVYAGESFDWKSATITTVSGNSPTINIGALADLTPDAALIAQYLSGQDRIVGTILLNLTALTFGRTADAGDEKPLQDATVYLTTTDGTRLASTTTDANGSYSFTGLNGQTYSIQVEYPSTVYSTPPPTTVTTDGSNNSVDVVNAAMIKNRATSASPQNGATFVWTHLVLYPNPALDQVNIKCTACQEVRSVDWIDYNGRIVATVPARYSGNFEWQIDRPALTKGNYILRWNSAAGSQSAPIVLE
jgi:hypothetical protein